MPRLTKQDLIKKRIRTAHDAGHCGSTSSTGKVCIRPAGHIGKCSAGGQRGGWKKPNEPPEPPSGAGADAKIDDLMALWTAVKNEREFVLRPRVAWSAATEDALAKLQDEVDVVLARLGEPVPR